MSRSPTGDDMPSTMDYADFDHFAESRTELPVSSPQTQQQFESGAFETTKKAASLEEITRLSSDSSYSEDEEEETPGPTSDSAVLLGGEDTGDKEKDRSDKPPAVVAATMKTIPNEKWELTQAVRAHRERNAMLGLLNSELNQELLEANEERLALEIQLENLDKPVSSC